MEKEFAYLNKLLSDANSKIKQFDYYEIDETDAEITYLSTARDRNLGRKCGLMNELRMQKLNIKEHTKLKSGSQNYLRIVRLNNRTQRIDSFVSGRVDVMFLAYYEDDKRYLFPFTIAGKPYPAYTYIARYEKGMVSEEYKVNKIQIVYEKYKRWESNVIFYSQINYVPGGTHKILYSEKGVFELSSPLVYTETDWNSWLDSRKK
jgi:hypothetical protein